jgi:hypothetical protein
MPSVIKKGVPDYVPKPPLDEAGAVFFLVYSGKNHCAGPGAGGVVI